MRKRPFLLLLIPVFLLTSCIQNSFLYSPNNANSNPYHAIPLRSDSIRGVTYVSSIFTLGGANQNWRDGLYAFQGRLHRSNNFGDVQAYYGANLTLGDYKLASYQNYYNVYDSTYAAANKFYGSYGFNGGMNFVTPTRHGGEWRVLGIETSVQREFGNYYSFRKSLPDSNANVIFRNNLTGTLGLYTDIISKSARGNEFGYKMSWGFLLNPESDYTHTYGSSNIVNPLIYFSNAIHWTRGNMTGFFQANFSLRYAANMQFGINYRLGRNHGPKPGNANSP